MRSCFACVAFHFYDDGLTLGVASEKGSAQRAYGMVQGLLGTKLDPGKHVPMSPRWLYTGVIFDATAALSQGELLVLPKPERIEAVATEVDECLASGVCKRSTCLRIRGRAGFLGSQLAGKVTRCYDFELARHAAAGGTVLRGRGPFGAPPCRRGCPAHLAAQRFGPRRPFIFLALPSLRP